MEKIYSLEVLSGAEEYIAIAEDLTDLGSVIAQDERQFLTRNPITLTLSEDGGLDVPDALTKDGVLLVSERLKQIIEDEGQEQVFFKKAIVKDDYFGVHETFWIAVPPRIDCLDPAKSDFTPQTWDLRNGFTPRVRCTKVCIDPVRAGEYQIFRVSGTTSPIVYVRERLRDALAGQGFSAIDFIERQPRR